MFPIRNAREARRRLTREWDDAHLERNAKHRNLILAGNVLDEIRELGTEHVPDVGASRVVVDALGRSDFDGAAGIRE